MHSKNYNGWVDRQEDREGCASWNVAKCQGQDRGVGAWVFVALETFRPVWNVTTVPGTWQALADTPT